MFEKTFKKIDDILYEDSGPDSELDYIGQTSWIMFLRYLDELEAKRCQEAELRDQNYIYIIDEKFRWSNWAVPRDTDGKIDLNKEMIGPDLVNFVDLKLFPYLASFKLKTENPKTIQYKIGEIFSELKNKIQSGYNLRDILDYADKLEFQSNQEQHELSTLYEGKIKNMGNAGRNGGQYYTPRALIRSIITVVDPKLGETVFDPAVGSAGFLCESFEHMMKQRTDLSTDDLKKLKEETFYGKEKKNLAYIIGIMNMILHGIEAPNIVHTNTLSENIRDIQEKDRYDIILANPPFGSKEREEVQQNYDIKSSESAFLFLQYFIKSLKAGGRAGIVIKNTFLSNSDNAGVSLRKLLLETCNLHTVLDMPKGTFIGAGVQTVVLFFTKGQPTKKIWYYQLNPGRNMGKTNPLNDKDMTDFIKLQKSKDESEQSWTYDVADINKNDFDLSVKNPNLPEETPLRSPKEILMEMEILDLETKTILANIRELL